MARTVELKNDNNETREGVVGFSWTVFFFGSYVPMFRGDWGSFVIMLIAELFSFRLVNLVYSFTYNKSYTRKLLEKGYFPADDHSRQLLIQAGLIPVPDTQASESTAAVAPVSTPMTKANFLWAIIAISWYALVIKYFWPLYYRFAYTTGNTKYVVLIILWVCSACICMFLSYLHKIRRSKKQERNLKAQYTQTSESIVAVAPVFTRIPIVKDRLWWSVIGISGCALAIWSFWPIYCWLDFLGYTTSKICVFMTLLVCVGSIFVFLYSLFDGKWEMYFRLAAGFALVIILLWMIGEGIVSWRYEPQLSRCRSGLFAAFICLFYPSKLIIGQLLVLILFSYNLYVTLTPAVTYNMRYLDWFNNFPVELIREASNYRTYLEKENRHYDEDRDITDDFKKYFYEHAREALRGNEKFRGILSRGGVSFVVQGGQWYQRVNIPVLLPHYINLNMPLEHKEELISAIKKMERNPEVVFYDGISDTYDVLIRLRP